jgi:hypothetical protein
MLLVILVMILVKAEIGASTALECSSKDTREIASKRCLWYAFLRLEESSSSSTDSL